MYQFIFGFCVGAYTATKYDLGLYVDTAEFAVKRFLKEAEKQAKTLQEDDKMKRSEDDEERPPPSVKRSD